MPEYKTLHYFSIKGRGLYLAFGKLAGGGGGCEMGKVLFFPDQHFVGHYLARLCGTKKTSDTSPAPLDFLLEGSVYLHGLLIDFIPYIGDV